VRPRSLRARLSAFDVAAVGTGRNGVVLVFESLVVKEQEAPSPVRVPWNAFPDVIVHSSIYKLKCLPAYYAAKHGDHKAASKIAHALVKTENIPGVEFVVPVIQVDGGRYNAIPVAVGAVLAKQIGARLWLDVGQINKVDHTDAGAQGRLQNQPIFGGLPPKGKCLICDDVVTYGATLGNLRGFLMAYRARVVGATTCACAAWRFLLHSQAFPEPMYFFRALFLRFAASALLGVLLFIAEIEILAQSSGGSTFSDANWSSLSAGVNGEVDALAVSGSDLYLGGQFLTTDGSRGTNIAKWNGSWAALGSGMNREVRALALSGSDLYAGGDFTNAGGISANYIAKWDGSSWSALSTGVGGGSFVSGPSVAALGVSSSNVYAGGSFTIAGAIAANRIARWDGTYWWALGSGMNGVVRALAVSGGDLYAGGDFTKANGISANNVAKWDGSSWSALGPGLNGEVEALVLSGSNVYAGGKFFLAGGPTPIGIGIAKWDGSIWSELGSGINNWVWALAASGSNVYAGGDFTKADGNAANYIAKWDGSSWTALGAGMNNSVWALAVSGSDLYAGGIFSSAGGKASPHIARAFLRPLPELSVLRSASDVLVSWPSVDTASFALEHSGTLDTMAIWVTNSSSVNDDGTNKSVTLPGTNSTQFFRLRRP
jgi:hypothetical protein